MSNRWKRIWIGLFVALALVLLGSMILLFNNLPQLFQQSNVYTIRFPEAPGLAPGSPVRRSGVRIGEVTDVKLDDEKSDVLVQVALVKPYVIRHNEVPTLVASLFGGDAAIELVQPPLVEGQPPQDRSVVPPGTEVAGVRAVTVNALLNRASEVVPTTQETLNDMRKSLQRVEKMAPLVEDTLREYRDLARSLNNTVPDLRRTNDEIRELAKRSREAIPGFERDAEDIASTARTWDKLGENLRVLLQANQDKIVAAVDRLNDVLARTAAVLSDENQRNVAATLKNMEAGTRGLEGVTHNADELLKEGRSTLRRFNETMTHLDEAATDIRKLTKPFADRGDTVATNLDASLDKLNRTLSDLREIVRVAGQSDGTLHRFLTDPSLYNHLDEAACAAAKLTPRLDRILKDVETFADKLARHPESIGLGGVVRPGSGLKDAPSPPGTFYPQH